jgi:hypothetical protein
MRYFTLALLVQALFWGTASAADYRITRGVSTKCTSPAYRIAFLKKALRNLSKAFSFF